MLATFEKEKKERENLTSSARTCGVLLALVVPKAREALGAVVDLPLQEGWAAGAGRTKM